jgi:hypothetical protein
MFQFECVLHRPNHEEFEVYLPAGCPRSITGPIDIDGTGRKGYQLVGHFVLSRSAPSGLEKLVDHFCLAVHPDLNETEREELRQQVEGLCGKHVYNGSQEDFEPMMVLKEELTA